MCEGVTLLQVPPLAAPPVDPVDPLDPLDPCPGFGAADTVTVALAGGDVPAAPVQVSVKVVVFAGDTARVPLVAFAPVQPPEAVHAVALLEDQVSVELPPAVMLVALADKVAVGGGVAATVTVVLAGADLPLAPVQVNV